MSDELPQGWAETTVGELFASHGGGTPNRATAPYWNGNIPWLSSGDIKATTISESSETITKRGLEESAARLCRKGSVLVVVRSGILKHTLPVAVLEREAAINQDIKSFDSGHDELNRWLSLAWRASARKLLVENREGTTVQSVKLETLNDFVLPLVPLAEQRRIVAKLETLLGKVDASQQRLAKIPVLLKRFRQSVLAAACSGRLTADWREENPTTNGITAVAENNLPSSWTSCVLKDVASVISGFAFSSRDFTDAGVPSVKISNVQYGEFVEKNQEYLPESFLKQHPSFVVVPQTLLMALTRPITNDTLKVCLYPKAAKPGLLNQRVCKLEPSARIGRDYLHLFMQTQPFKTQVEENLSETLQPNLSPKALDSFSVSLPPLLEQQEIVRRVEGLFALADQLEVRLAKARGRVDQLTPSLLARAFAGQLVPQDPTDEPADKLLERIRTSRAAD